MKVALLLLLLHQVFIECRSRSSIASYYNSLYSGNILSLELLDEQTDGKCIDGTPAGYYLRIAVNKKNQTPAEPYTSNERNDDLSDNWILYLEGGAWCYNDIDCYLRSFEDLGSSKNYHRLLPDRFGGLLAKDDDLNYPFSTYNLVYVKYCDGNTFAGNREDPVYVNSKPLYFRGKRVKERVLESLLKRTHFYDAENIIVTGCSAGGLSTLVQADSIAEWAHLNLKKKEAVDVAAVPISGFFVDLPNIHGQPVYRNQMVESFLLTNATAGLNQNCVRERRHMKTIEVDQIPFYSEMYRKLSSKKKSELLDNDVWRCNMGEYSFPHSSTRTFVLNSAIDSYQRDCILSAMPVSTDLLQRAQRLTHRRSSNLQRTCDTFNKYLNVNGNCSAAEGFTHCGIDLTDCPVTTFAPLVDFQRRFLNRTLSAFEAAATTGINLDGTVARPSVKPSPEVETHHGAFLSSCITHCEGKRDSSWDTIKIDNVSIRHAVLEWYFHTSKNPQSLESFYTSDDGYIVLRDKSRTKVLSKRSNRIYVDCALSMKDYDECNPTCIQ